MPSPFSNVDQTKLQHCLQHEHYSITLKAVIRFRTRSAGLREEVGGWKNKEEARQCVMCSEGEEESVEHVLMRCTAYRSEREQL